MVKVLETKADFDDAISSAGDTLVVVDFFATWCPPCVAIAPVFASISEEETDGKQHFCKIDSKQLRILLFDFA
jgi:thioredoxin 1